MNDGNISVQKETVAYLKFLTRRLLERQRKPARKLNQDDRWPSRNSNRIPSATIITWSIIRIINVSSSGRLN